VVTNDNLARYIEENNKGKSGDVKDIIKSSLSLTSKQLKFTFSKNNNDPNLLIDSKSANCIGYAAFFSAVCNYQLKKNQLSDQWTARPQVARIYFLGMNIHRYFDTPFFKDHDFVIVENKNTGETFAVDPSVHDYLRIGFVTTKKISLHPNGIG